MDTRGQGSVWGTGGATPDPHGSGPATPGYMTRGIAHPDTARKPRGERSRKAHSKPQPIKFAQLHPYKGPEWRGHFGMRSLVEASNYLLKTAPHGDIENTSKRSGRGYAAVYLALTFAVVTSNLKRIATFFVKEAERLELAVKKQRARRRKDDLGRPLAKPALAAPPGT